MRMRRRCQKKAAPAYALRVSGLASRHKYGTPTAQRPYLFYEVLPHPPARQRARSPQGRDGAPPPSDLRGASRLCIQETAHARLNLGSPTASGS